MTGEPCQRRWQAKKNVRLSTGHKEPLSVLFDLPLLRRRDILEDYRSRQQVLEVKRLYFLFLLGNNNDVIAILSYIFGNFRHDR